MAGGVNKAIIVGRLGSDPELRYTQTGQAIATFSVATSEMWTNRDGKKEERTEWHKIVVWGKQGENCGQYLAKGRQVYIEGKIQTRQWEDKTGQKRYTTEIVGNQIVFLAGGGPNASAGGSNQGYERNRPNAQTGNTQAGGAQSNNNQKKDPFGGYDEQALINEDDIPF